MSATKKTAGTALVVSSKFLYLRIHNDDVRSFGLDPSRLVQITIHPKGGLFLASDTKGVTLKPDQSPGKIASYSWVIHMVSYRAAFGDPATGSYPVRAFRSLNGVRVMLDTRKRR